MRTGSRGLEPVLRLPRNVTFKPEIENTREFICSISENILPKNSIQKSKPDYYHKPNVQTDMYEVFAAHISKTDPTKKLPKNITSKMAKQIATLRLSAQGMRASFMAIPKRAEICSIKAKNDTILKPGQIGFIHIYTPHIPLENRIWWFKPRSFSKDHALVNIHIMPC